MSCWNYNRKFASKLFIGFSPTRHILCYKIAFDNIHVSCKKRHWTASQLFLAVMWWCLRHCPSKVKCYVLRLWKTRSHATGMTSWWWLQANFGLRIPEFWPCDDLHMYIPHVLLAISFVWVEPRACCRLWVWWTAQIFSDFGLIESRCMISGEGYYPTYMYLCHSHFLLLLLILPPCTSAYISVVSTYQLCIFVCS